MTVFVTYSSNCLKVKQWALVNQKEGWFFVFGAQHRQQIKMTGHKQASEGQAKESISGEKQGSKRHINVQTTLPLQQWRKHNHILQIGLFLH